MRYEVRIKGIRPLIQHNGAAELDTRSPANLEKAEITRKRGSNRTATDDERLRELDCQTSLWLDASGAAAVPPGAVRAMIETAARKLKQGPQVREGMIVESVLSFDYDRKKYGSTVEELCKNAQFTTAVVVQRNRILRTQAPNCFSNSGRKSGWAIWMRASARPRRSLPFMRAMPYSVTI